MKSISLPPPSKCSRNINSTARSQHAALRISIYIKTLVQGQVVSYSCCSRGALSQPLLTLSKQLAAGEQVLLWAAQRSLAALGKFSFCTGSLPTSGCFHCPQPRFWLLSERHPLLFSTQIAPPHWFSQTMFPDAENENCGTGVCEISNSMIHPTPWQDRKPFYIC